MLFPTSLNKIKYLDVYENGDFELKNFFPEKGEYLKFTTLKKSGIGKKPKVYLANPNPIQKDQIQVQPDPTLLSFYYDKNDAIPFDFVRDRVEQLDEIVLNARLDSLKRSRAPFKGRIIKIDDQTAKTFKTVDQLLNTEHNLVLDYELSFQDGLLYEQADRVLKSADKRDVALLVEGRRVQNLNHFLMTGTHEYEDVYIDKTGWVIVINLFLRRSPFKSEDLNNSVHKRVQMKHGFEPQKEFYAPGYVSYDIQPFKNYGIIHWEPNVTLKKGSNFEFKTVNTGLKKTSFYIEGISNDGLLFSQVIHTDDETQKALK